MTFDDWRNTDNNYCLIHSVNDSKEIWSAAWNEALEAASAYFAECEGTDHDVIKELEI